MGIISLSAAKVKAYMAGKVGAPALLVGLTDPVVNPVAIAAENELQEAVPVSTTVRLLTLVREVVDTDPYPAEGFMWASRPQEWWAEQLGRDPKTIQRLSHKPPFRWVRKRVDGRPRILLREAIPGEPPSPEEYARPMVAVWRNHWRTPERETRHDYGRLVELAKHWKSLGPAILKTVLDEWSGFMMSVEHHQLETGEGEKKYFDFPSTSVILRYRATAYGLHMHAVQSKQADDMVKASGAADW